MGRLGVWLLNQDKSLHLLHVFILKGEIEVIYDTVGCGSFMSI